MISNQHRKQQISLLLYQQAPTEAVPTFAYGMH